MAAVWRRDGTAASQQCVSSTFQSYYSAEVEHSEPSASAFGARAVWVAAACLLGVATALLFSQNGHTGEAFRLPALRPGHRLALRAAPSSRHQPTNRWEVEIPADNGAPQEADRRQPTLRTAIVAGALASALQANADTPDFDLFSNLDTSAYDAATTRADVGKVKKTGDFFGGLGKDKGTAPDTKAPVERPKPRERPPRPVAPPKVYGEPGASKGSPLLLAGGVGALAVGLLGFLLTRSTPNTRTQAKRTLLQAIEGTGRGYRTPEDEAPAILSAIKALEKQNSVDSPLRSAFIDGKWELLYSTSDRVLAVSKGKATVETLDLDAGTYKLEAGPGFTPFFGANTTDVLDVVDARKARVMKADGRTAMAMKAAQREKGSLRSSTRQASAAGATAVVAELTTTYLDDTWRVTRDAEGVSVFRRQGAVDDFSMDEEDDAERPRPSGRVSRIPVVMRQEQMDSKPTRAPAPSFFGRPKRAVVEEEEEEEEEAPAPKPASKPWFGLPKSPAPKPVEEEEDDEEAPAPKPASKPWFGVPKLPTPKRGAAASVEEDDDEEAPAPKPASKPWFGFPTPKRAAAPVEEDDDEEEEEAPAPKPAPRPKFEFPKFPAPKPRVQDKPEPEEDEDEEEEEAPKPKPKPKPAPAFKFPSFGNSALKKTKVEVDEGAARTVAKAALFDLLPDVDRGADATPEEEEAIELAIQAVEALNPTAKALESPLLGGKWELLYTTSNSVLALNRPPALRPKGPIYQYVDVDTMSLTNTQTLTPVGNIAVPASVKATLTAQGDNRVGVKFTQFGLGPLKLNRESEAWLDITYLDDELRVSRGSQGNVFVLKMADRDAVQPAAK